MKTLYEILEVSETASMSVITAAWKDHNKRLHPDLNKTADPAILQAINNAYSVLSDEKQRRDYDDKLKAERAYTENQRQYQQQQYQQQQAPEGKGKGKRRKKPNATQAIVNMTDTVIRMSGNPTVTLLYDMFKPDAEYLIASGVKKLERAMK